MSNIPVHNGVKFQCPHCQTIAQQRWFDSSNASGTTSELIMHLFFNYRTTVEQYEQNAISRFLKAIDNEFSGNLTRYFPKDFSIATCVVCNKSSYWSSKEMVYPKKTSLPQPNDDMNDDIKELYREAMKINEDSPRGSAALLRLALQKLLMQLGKPGKNLNDDIKALVSEGLHPSIQRALDIVRVVGNNAVHPGEIDLDENKEIALKLFYFINLIAEELITKPRQIREIYGDIIPEETKSYIQKRDKK